jgi:hypothetical protein
MRRAKGGPRDAALLRAAAALAALALAPNCSEDVGEGDQFPSVTVRVSVKAFGEEATGPITALPNSITGATPDGFLNANLSADGRYVVFESNSPDLTSGDANGLRDIFVKDRLTGAVENITNIASGEFGPHPHDCFSPVISGNGRFVAFESRGVYTANGMFGIAARRNIWVFDREARTFEPATLFNIFAEPNQDCSGARLSADGRFVAWHSNATNFSGYTTANFQVYVTDLMPPGPGNPIKLLSHPPGNLTTGGNGPSSSPSISANGAFVAFESSADNIDPPGPVTDPDTTSDIYVADVAAGTVELASIGFNPATMADEKSNDFCFTSLLSGDGQFVFFITDASNWGLPPVPPSRFRLVRRQRPGGPTGVATDQITSIVSIIAAPDRVQVSDDGQTVAYARNQQTAVTYIPTGETRTVSVNTLGQTGDFRAWVPGISGDGRWAVWHTLAGNLVPGDTNGLNDVYVHGPLR